MDGINGQHIKWNKSLSQWEVSYFFSSNGEYRQRVHERGNN